MTIKEMIDERKVFSPTDLAAYLGIGKGAAYDLFNEPGFPCFYIGSRKFVMWSDLYTWLHETKSISVKKGGAPK